MSVETLTLVDSHAHLEMAAFDPDREDVLTRAAAAGVEFILTIGNAQPEEGSMEKALLLCARHPGLATTVGIHPHDARIAAPVWYRLLLTLAENPRVWAMGEIGLDFFYDHSPRDIQREVLMDQLRLARELWLPVIIHCRDAGDELLAVLESLWAPPNPGGIMHCFAGDASLAGRCLDLGFYISFAGNITFPKAESIRQAALAVPLDRLLIETDCPYLAPVPRRGRRNEPALVRHVAEALAGLRGVPPAAMARLTTDNFKKLFHGRFGG